MLAVVAGTASVAGSPALRAATAARVPTGPPAAGPTALAPAPSAVPFAPGLPVASGQDESDPVAIVADGHYVLLTSGRPGLPPVNVPVSVSSDFATWSPATDALPVLPAWAVPGYTWAPDLHRFGSHWMLYFTAMLRGTRPAVQCIGSAVGTDPTGPFVASPVPFICQLGMGGSIDPRVFVDADGSTWMLWKSDQNIGGATTPTLIWSQRLAPDGRTLVGVPAAILRPDEPWQGTIVEAPDLVRAGSAYWLFYSGNWFNQPAYAIGAARCAGPLGPCADTSPFPLLATNLQGSGPGEASAFEDAGGIWLLYSPWRSLAPKPDLPPRPVFVTRLCVGQRGPYLAAGGPPDGLDLLVPSLVLPAAP